LQCIPIAGIRDTFTAKEWRRFSRVSGGVGCRVGLRRRSGRRPGRLIARASNARAVG
jgi:hypothetical protein